jgi:hypothetical protein
MARTSKSLNMAVETFEIGGGAFSFEGATVGDLGASGYGVGCLGIDITGSTAAYASQLREMAVAVVLSCTDKKNPFRNNMLLRTFTFNSDQGIVDLHGFIPVLDIDHSNYPNFNPDGYTPLIDAGYSATGSVIEYARNLKEAEFTGNNGTAFLVTDGGENRSKSGQTLQSIKKMIEKAREDRVMLSFELVVIGINTAQCRRELESFCAGAGAKFIDAGEVTPGKLAHIGGLVSQSFSASAQSAAVGQPSKPISTDPLI